MAPSPTPGVDRNQSSTLTTVTHISLHLVQNGRLLESRHRRRNGNNTACVCAAFKLHGTLVGTLGTKKWETARHKAQAFENPSTQLACVSVAGARPTRRSSSFRKRRTTSRALKLWCIRCVLLYQVISRPSSHITSIGISLAVNKGFKAGQSLAWRPVQVLQEDMSIHQHCYSGSSLPPLHLDFNPGFGVFGDSSLKGASFDDTFFSSCKSFQSQLKVLLRQTMRSSHACHARDNVRQHLRSCLHR